MFTNNKVGYIRDGKVLIEASCLSTDTKPTEGIANGSCLIEMDTGDTYAFDETGAGTWRKLSSSGGGGSSLPAVTSDDNGDVLTVVNGAWDKASPSGGGALMVNVVVEPAGSGSAIQVQSIDKTLDEITDALDAGINVVVKAGMFYEGVIATYMFLYPMDYDPALEESPSRVAFASTRYEKGNPNYITSYRLTLSSQAGVDPVFVVDQGSF